MPRTPKKNNFNQRKIERHIAYIDAKLEEYSGILASEDGDDNNKKEARDEIQKHPRQREKYEQIQEDLKVGKEVQISTSGPDSKQLIPQNHITEVAYSIPSSVDDKHNIPIDFKVTNNNNSKAMGNIVRRAN